MGDVLDDRCQTIPLMLFAGGSTEQYGDNDFFIRTRRQRLPYDGGNGFGSPVLQFGRLDRAKLTSRCMSAVLIQLFATDQPALIVFIDDPCHGPELHAVQAFQLWATPPLARAIR